MPRLNTNSKKAAQVVADKIASKGQSITQEPIVINNQDLNIKIDSTVPGLPTLTPDLLPAMMPQFHPNQYSICDPLNPPESLPQASQAQFDKGMAIYEGAQRALKLTGSAFDVVRERFTVVNKQAKAFGAGVLAATELEKVKGNYLDYLSQLQSTQQKGIKLDVANVTTATDRAIALHTKEELAQKLEQSRLKSEKSKLDTQERLGALDSFRQQLGEYLPRG